MHTTIVAALWEFANNFAFVFVGFVLVFVLIIVAKYQQVKEYT